MNLKICELCEDCGVDALHVSRAVHIRDESFPCCKIIVADAAWGKRTIDEISGGCACIERVRMGIDRWFWPESADVKLRFHDRKT